MKVAGLGSAGQAERRLEKRRHLSTSKSWSTAGSRKTRLEVRSRNSPTTGLGPMEAEFVRHNRYSLRPKASSLFLLALLIRLSVKLHDLNYNNCLLERFPTQIFLVRVESCSHARASAPSGATRRDRTPRIAGNYTRTVGGNMGSIVSGTEALGAEALATEDALATE